MIPPITVEHGDHFPPELRMPPRMKIRPFFAFVFQYPFCSFRKCKFRRTRYFRIRHKLPDHVVGKVRMGDVFARMTESVRPV